MTEIVFIQCVYTLLDARPAVPDNSLFQSDIWQALNKYYSELWLAACQGAAAFGSEQSCTKNVRE